MKRSYKTVKVNGAWVKENIVKPGWQRNLYPARVNKFISKMKNGEFIKSLITVGKEKGSKSLVLLDGQHKIEAIVKAEKTFDMDLCVYENLEEEEMIQVYKVLNDVKAPRLIDDLKTYVGRHEWLDAFFNKERFPINVTLGGGVNSMRIDSFLNVLYNGLRNTISRMNLSRNKLPEFMEGLGAAEYSIMKDFCQFYKECYGEPTIENWLYKNVVMFTMFKIWNANKDVIKRQDMIECFKRVEAKTDIRRLTYAFDLTALENLTRAIYKTLNYRRSTNYFVIFWDETLKI